MYRPPYQNENILRNGFYNRVNFRQTDLKKKLNNVSNVKDVEKTNVSLFVKDFFLFILETSSIHGFRHLSKTSLHIIEYLLWLACIIMGIFGIYSLSSSTWNHYQNSPTVTSIENNYQDWGTVFPAITVCPMNKIATDTDVFYNNIIGKKIVEVENVEQLYEFMKQLTNWSYAEGESVIEYNDIKPSDYIWVFAEGKQTFQHTMSFNEIPDLLKNDLKLYITEHGVCYGYLSKMTVYSTPQYWKTKRWDYRDGGSSYGSNALDGDNYFQFTFTDTNGFLVFIHSPEEIPDSASKLNTVHRFSMKTLGLSGLSIYSTDATLDLSVHQRQCRFLWESNLEISAVYTYNLCRMNCRHHLANKLCGCVPFFYRQLNKYKVCTSAGLLCLSKYRELLIKLRDENGKKVSCTCLPPCNDVNYGIEEERTLDWGFGSELRWGIIKYPRIRYKKDIIFGFTDVLVSTGGTAGLFLGCSVLSFVEMFYFVTFRLIWSVKNKNKVSIEDNNKNTKKNTAKSVGLNPTDFQFYN